MRISRMAATVGLAATVALSVAACGSSSSTKTTATPSASAVNVNTPTVTVAKLTGTQTAVTLDTDTVKALGTLGVTVGVIAPAHGVTLADGMAVAFPITGGNVTVYPVGHQPGYVTGSITHSGGISLTVGKKVLKLTNFIIDPGTSMLSATINGTGMPTPIFFLDGSALKITKPDATYHLDGTKVELTSAAAGVIDSYFGVKAGTVPAAEIGIAHIIAS